jgi:hypothetical protein
MWGAGNERRVEPERADQSGEIGPGHPVELRGVTDLARKLFLPVVGGLVLETAGVGIIW